MGKVKKKARIPEVLWRLFHNKARTLADTILSLLPSPPPALVDCQCKKRRGCLGCSGDKAMSYLVRPEDPAEYRKLLNQCFVVIPEQAPPFSGFDPHKRWSQLKIVTRNIEMIISDKSSSSNVLSSGYNKANRFSTIVKRLTSSAWRRLLKRVGDNLMCYLLRNTLIFLPLPPRKHQQAAGFPISDLCIASSKNLSKFRNHPSKFHLGSGKKRKRVDGADVMENLENPSTFNTGFSSRAPSCIGCSDRNNFTPSNRCCQRKISQKSKVHGTVVAAGAQHFSTEACSLEELQGGSAHVSRSKKRLRKYSWQRHRKRRHLSSQECGALIPSTSSLIDYDNSCVQLQSGVNTYSGLYSEETRCSCCLVFQTLHKVVKKAQIDRRRIFYKLEHYPSIFPRKPANVLFRDIFGSDVCFTDHLVPCVHSTRSCGIKSACLYHSLMKQLKILIRRIRGCQLLRFLDKHCGSTSSLDQLKKSGLTMMFEGNESGGYMHQNGGSVHASDFSSEKFIGTDLESRIKIAKAHDHQLQSSMGYCLKKQVVSYIWAVCRSIVPQDLLGSPYNWRILRKNISKFVCLRRFEKFSLKQCTQNLKISEFPFLSNEHSLCYISNNDSGNGKRSSPGMPWNSHKHNMADAVRQKLLQCWILWFFSSLVVPLIQANFYVTESESGKQEVYYYRTTVWQKLMDQNLVTLKDCGFHEVTDASSVNNIITNRSFGFSRIRFRPRATGFRILANFGAPSRVPLNPSSSSSKMRFSPRGQLKKSVNSVLQGVHAVLKGIQLHKPEKLGSSVFDYTDVYRKFVPFLNVLKWGSTIPGVYIIVSDVSKAFDSIDHKRLLNVMEDVVSRVEYPLDESLQVGCTRKSFMVCQHLMSPLQEHESIPSGTPHGILVKEEPSSTMKKKEIISHLSELIKHNVLQLDRKFYLQSVGISQGCVVSSLLCSFYFGAMENEVIFPLLEKAGKPVSADSFDEQTPYQTSASEICPEIGTDTWKCEYLLLRFIDDFLFISTSKKQASLFFSRLKRGIRSYNCYMNERKFGLNFVMDHTAPVDSNRLYVSGNGMSFLRWSGLLVNCSTLEIQADYSRYLNGHLSESLTISLNDHPIRLLKSKLCDYLLPKCHPIFYDANINSAAVIRLNIYQVFLLCAMKFNCYICNFSGEAGFSTECCMDAIETSLRYMHNCIKRKMRVLRVKTGFRPVFSVKKEEVKWLGLMAFIQALSRKQSHYRELLRRLRCKLKAQEEKAVISASLKYAVDGANSSELWKIQY